MRTHDVAGRKGRRAQIDMRDGRVPCLIVASAGVRGDAHGAGDEERASRGEGADGSWCSSSRRVTYPAWNR
jgi:hypothetical protein